MKPKATLSATEYVIGMPIILSNERIASLGSFDWIRLRLFVIIAPTRTKAGAVIGG